MHVDPARYQTPPEIAARYGCKPETVIGWIRSGELKAINLAKRGAMKPRFRVSPDALEAFELARSVVPREPTVKRPPRDLNIKRFV
ncbi:helix-turn-helix domain-containing protein [Schlesneria sp.]|uniref:helix-turn-helix domain-containing protein n=1 Tax=Schlesneria sp. TaxID=2762018 RepID=UPI002F255D1E